VALQHPTYRRGFLDPVCLGSVFTRVAPRLAELMPLHHLRVFKARVAMTAVAACPQLAHVRRLTLASNVLRNGDVAALVPSPHLGHLTHLDLSGNHIGVRGAADLATATLPALRVLQLRNNPIRDGLCPLILGPWPALEHLDVDACGLRGGGATALADSSLVRRLRALLVSGNPDVPTAAWVRLASAPCARLTRLEVRNPAVTEDVLVALAANPALANLRVLNLGLASVTDRGARALSESPHLRGLTSLRLPDKLLSAAVRDGLRAAFGPALNPR
jgi:hypothetical protein